MAGVGADDDALATLHSPELDQAHLKDERRRGVSLFSFPYVAIQLIDDVAPEVKQERLVRMSNAFREEAAKLNQELVGSEQIVLVEGVSTITNIILPPSLKGELLSIKKLGSLYSF